MMWSDLSRVAAQIIYHIKLKVSKTGIKQYGKLQKTYTSYDNDAESFEMLVSI